MDNYKEYKLKEINDKLNKYKKDYESKIALWRKVERVKKKDGSDFSVLSKNFKNARIVPASASIRTNYEIQVSDYINGAYISDYFELYPCVKYYKGGDISPDRIIKEPCCEPYFAMTLDEISDEINRTIELYTGRIKALEKQINDAEKVFSEFSDAIDNALKTLKTDAGDGSILYYACREYMTKSY